MSSRKEKRQTEEEFKRITGISKREWGNFEPLKQKLIKYKTVFQLVYENTTEDAEEAEARAIAQLKLIVGEKGASHIMSRSYPVTTEMER